MENISRMASSTFSPKFDPIINCLCHLNTWFGDDTPDMLVDNSGRPPGCLALLLHMWVDLVEKEIAFNNLLSFLRSYKIYHIPDTVHLVVLMVFPKVVTMV